MLKILDRAEKDAERMRQSARVCLEIDGNSFNLSGSKEPKINVIAVIGSTPETNGRKVVLEEIGIWRTRPFAEGKVSQVKSNGGVRFIAPRVNVFYPTEEQYKLLAPTIFSILQSRVDFQTSKWKRGPHDPIYVWSPHNWYSRAGKKMYYGATTQFRPRGLRFSIRSTSQLLLSDLYWAELNLNQSLISGLDGLAKFIDLRLDKYRRSWKCRKEFQKLKGVREIQRNLETRNRKPHKYLLEEMLNYLPGGGGNRFSWYLRDLFGLNGQASIEKEISSRVIEDPEARLGKIQLRIISGIAEAKHYVSFEVFPNGN